jgi:uncharacterized cofD-like protein
MTNQDEERNILVTGGGTGTNMLLSGLKHQNVNLTAVVSIADDGGSTGRLRDELGVLPPGDIRQCLAALAEGDDVLRNLMNHRFTKGALKGHNSGNLLISALEDMYGSAESGLKMAHKLLRVRGRVIPVSAQATTLYAELEDRTLVEGEHAIDVPAGERSPIRQCLLDPIVYANPEAVDAIMNAHVIVLGPGDLYTSLVPVLLVEGITDALAETSAKFVYVMNLVSKPGQTEGYTAKRFMEKLSPYLRPAKLDTVILNTAPIPEPILQRYTEAGEHVIVDDLEESEDLELVRADVLSDKIIRATPGDQLKRSLLRHDSKKLAKIILSLTGGG